MDKLTISNIYIGDSLNTYNNTINNGVNIVNSFALWNIYYIGSNNDINIMVIINVNIY